MLLLFQWLVQSVVGACRPHLPGFHASVRAMHILVEESNADIHVFNDIAFVEAVQHGGHIVTAVEPSNVDIQNYLLSKNAFVTMRAIQYLQRDPIGFYDAAKMRLWASHLACDANNKIVDVAAGEEMLIRAVAAGDVELTSLLLEKQASLQLPKAIPNSKHSYCGRTRNPVRRFTAPVGDYFDDIWWSTMTAETVEMDRALFLIPWQMQTLCLDSWNCRHISVQVTDERWTVSLAGFFNLGATGAKVEAYTKQAALRADICWKARTARLFESSTGTATQSKLESETVSVLHSIFLTDIRSMLARLLDLEDQEVAPPPLLDEIAELADEMFPGGMQRTKRCRR